MLKLLLSTLILAGAAAAPTSAQMVPSTPDAIAAATVDCWESFDGPNIDETRLRSKGWELAKITSRSGEPRQTPLRVYGKGGSGVVMMLNSADMSNCLITSLVARPEDIGVSAQLLLNRLQVAAPGTQGKRDGQSIVYFAPSRVAILRPGGTMEKPSAVIQVGYVAPEKK